MVLWLDLLNCYFLLLWLFGPFPGHGFTCFVPVTHTSCCCVPVFDVEQFGSIFLYMASPPPPLFLYVLVGLFVTVILLRRTSTEMKVNSKMFCGFCVCILFGQTSFRCLHTWQYLWSYYLKMCHPRYVRSVQGTLCIYLHILCFSCKLRGLSPRANYTDRAAAAGRRS